MMPSTGPFLMVGKTFGHYTVIEKAGAGGMGVVYRAHDETLHRDVALKLPSTDTATTSETRARILAEARAASALNHPHICTIYEVGEFEGQPYIAMEYISGETLSRRIPGNGMPTESVLDLGAQVADAMDHAHSHGILHRDLKSANVRMTSSGQLKVLDFGLALNVNDTSLEGATRTSILDSGGVAGTLAYLAPELLQGKPPDAQTDIWSLGVLLYELAAGKLPFQGRTGFELTTAILRESPPALPAHVTPGLRAVIFQCLAKNPAKRYQHASEVRAALEALQSDTGFTPRAEVAAAKDSSRLYLIGTVALAAAIVVGVLLYGRFNKTSGGPSVGGKLRLFLSSDGNLSSPALSPDGKMVAYVQTVDGKDELYVSRVAGGEHVRLTHDGIGKEQPQFSPDGEKIVFVRQTANSAKLEICLIPAFGGAVVPLLSGVEYPSWSPDGSKLAFVQRKQGEAETLVVAAADGSNPQVLVKADDVYPFLTRPSWSPDGRVLAFSRSKGGLIRDIWTVPLQGGQPARLTKDIDGIASDNPVFTPDGRGVVHRSNRGGASNLWFQPLDGKAPVQLTTGPGPDSSPSVSRNGTIAFLNSRSRNSLLLYSLEKAAATAILSDPSKLWAPAISPDGQEITYSRDEPDGSWHLWSISVNGGTPRQMTFGKAPEIYPRYTPDGAQILFNTWGAEPFGLWFLPSKGGPSKTMTQPGSGSDAYADASPDGRSLVFVRTENKITHLYVAPTDGSASPRRVLELSGTVPRWSPDGKWISFSPNRSFSSGVLIVHPDGTGLRRLTDDGGWAVWWPDGEQIGFQAAGPDGNEQIRVFSLKTGTTRTLLNLPFVGQNFPFDVSRDGKWLATTNYQHLSDEIWLLEPSERK